MKKRTSSMSAQELMAKLQADPEYQERQAKREAMFAEKSARLSQEEGPILSDLKKVGWEVESVWDLVSSPGPYPEVIPILLKHLLLPYSDRTREGIARALAAPEPGVKEAWKLFVSEYLKAPMGQGVKFPGDTEEFNLGYKHGLACALSVAVTDETLPEYIGLLKDKSHGEYRGLLLEPLRKSKNPLAIQAIEELADDPDLKKEIGSWKKLKK